MYSHAYIRIYVYVHTYVCIGILLNYNVIVIESYFFFIIEYYDQPLAQREKQNMIKI